MKGGEEKVSRFQFRIGGIFVITTAACLLLWFGKFLIGVVQEPAFADDEHFQLLLSMAPGAGVVVGILSRLAGDSMINSFLTGLLTALLVGILVSFLIPIT